jgi:uncharacterized membrane protein YphA (DoxX/SURF4 family)
MSLTAPGFLAMQLLVTVFLAILFLQSGLDKLTDYKGNLEYLTGHFAKSPLKGMVPLMLPLLTLLELASGALNLGGAAQIYTNGSVTVAFWGALLAAGTITCLFFGQRLAKDYAGASGLVPYFLLTLVAIHLVQP